MVGSGLVNGPRKLWGRLWGLGLVLPVLLAAGGCATARPWQRGILAKRCMLPSPDPAEETLEQHFFAYREGSAGGTGGTGGGCGCN